VPAAGIHEIHEELADLDIGIHFSEGRSKCVDAGYKCGIRTDVE
jgi:hypothetical protein